MKTSKLIFTLLFALLTLWACEKEDEEDTIINIIESNDRAVINFEPNFASWYYRDFPDSIIIDIKNGQPPYVIAQKSDNAQARIEGSQLIVYPFISTFSTTTIRDFIVIKDNVDNENAFNFSVKSLIQYFNSSSSNYLINISGATNLLLDGPSYGNSRIDKFEKQLYVNFNQGYEYFNFQINNIDSVGTYALNDDNVIAREYFELTYRDTAGYSRRMNLNDTNQVINITTINDSLIAVNFNLDLYDEFWGVLYKYDVSGNVNLRR